MVKLLNKEVGDVGYGMMGASLLYSSHHGWQN